MKEGHFHTLNIFKYHIISTPRRNFFRTNIINNLSKPRVVPKKDWIEGSEVHD